MAELTRFTKKLNDASATFIAQRLACDIPSNIIAKEVQEQFGIKITTARINTLVKTDRWHKIYEVTRSEYLNKIRDFTGIAIAAQRTRLQEGDKIRARILKLIDKLELQLETIKKGKTTFNLFIVRELRSMMETYLKALNYGKSETDTAVKHIKAPEDNFNRFMKKIKEVKVIDVTPNNNQNGDINETGTGQNTA